MKKFLALLLAVMMIASMSVTAFAADYLQWAPGDDVQDGNGGKNTTTKSTQDVYVKMQGNTIESVYFVVVEWEALNFTYKFNTGVKWNPELHQYVNADNKTTDVGDWYVDVSENAQPDAKIEEAIKVTNHSDATVIITAAFGESATMTTNAVTATVSGEAAGREIGSAEGKAFGDESLTITYDVSVSGTPTTKAEFELGTITVTFSAN